MIQKYLKEVEAQFKKHQGPESKRAFIARYVGGVLHEDRKPDEQSTLQFYGLQVPAQKKIYSQGFSFTGSEHEFLIWDYVFKNSRGWEPKNMALMYVRRKKSDFYIQKWAHLKDWVHHVDNWAHSDELSHVYSQLLEDHFKLLKVTFDDWNKSQNPWLRRQSVVGLLNYSRFRKQHPPLKWMLSLVKNLIADPHVYVQKGVGWTLREIHNIAPKEQEAFVKKHLAQISPTAWFATSENYSLKLKKQLVEMRSKARKSKRKNKN